MISKIKIYAIAGLSAIAVFLYALLQRKSAQIEKDKARRATATKALQKRVTAAYAEGERKYREKVNRPVDRGHFTK